MPNRPIDSAADLNSRAELLRPKICQSETEDSWEVIAKNLASLIEICRNGACEFPADLIAFIRSISRQITTSLMTERTRLSSVAIDLVSAVALGLGKSFKPLLQMFLPTLLSLCGRTNKVIITRSKACIINIIEATQLPSTLSYFVQSMEDKSSSIRLTAAEGTLMCVNCFNPPDLEKDARVGEIELIIRVAAKDAQADIRVVGRKLFEAYKVLLPQRIESFTSPLSPTTKKYLGVKSISSGRLEAPEVTVQITKSNFSSSTSAISSTRGRPESSHPTVHARSASSSTLTSDRRTNSTSTKATATTSTVIRQKTEMLPPAFIPVRLSVSVSRSTPTVESRPRVVSAALPSRSVQTTTTIQVVQARPNSATSHRDAQRIRPQHPVPIVPGPSGPRRVPIPDALSMTFETTIRPQVPGARSRAATATSMTSQSDTKASVARLVQQQLAPAREKLKPVPKVREAPPPVSSRPAASTAATKPPKTGGVTQPTLSQISRAKANAEQKQLSISTQKQLSRPASKAPPSAFHQPNSQKGKVKPKSAGEKVVEKPTQMEKVPLPPSPVQSAIAGDEEVPPSPALNPATIVNEDENDITPEIPQEETAPPLVIIHSLHSTDAESETAIQAVEGCTEAEGPVDTRPTEEPSTPTLITADNIFDENAKTPISSLLSSIQRGFLFTPSSPLSPPQSYLDRGVGMPIPFSLDIDGTVIEQEKAPQVVKPFMFGVGGEGNGRSLLGSVENLNGHK